MKNIIILQICGGADNKNDGLGPFNIILGVWGQICSELINLETLLLLTLIINDLNYYMLQLLLKSF